MLLADILRERRRAMDRGRVVRCVRHLGDATTRVSFRLTNGNQIVVRNASDVARSNGDQRLGAARGRYESRNVAAGWYKPDAHDHR